MTDKDKNKEEKNGKQPEQEEIRQEPEIQIGNLNPKTLEHRDLEDEMKVSYLDYAMSVIVGRALPDVRDGLKPVHRRILYAAKDMGLLHSKPYRKCARVVGEVLGKYHPHGDKAVYDAMVRMVQDFSLRYPLMNGQGNFGSIDGDNAAAMRYTEIRMSKAAAEILTDIDKETVDFTPNFDGSMMEPTVLPSNFPNLLVNGSAGIAVGMATNIPPHNLKEVNDALEAMIDDPDITIKQIMKHVKAPDFPTGALICGRESIVKAYETGRGSVEMRAKVSKEDLPHNKTALIVDELPYQVNKAAVIEKIAELIRNKKIKGITDLRDESDRDGMRIMIELSSKSNSDVVLNQLYKHTALQRRFGITMIALVDNEPRILDLKEMLFYFLEHRRQMIRKSTVYDLRQAEARAHIVEGLRIALKNLDDVVKTIRASSDRKEAESKLVKKFGLSQKQAEAILDMRLHRLTSLEREKLEDEYKDLIKKIEMCKAILASPKKVDTIIKDQIKALSDTYGDKRRSEITAAAGDMSIEDLIKEEEMVVTISNAGYIKRLPLTTYRAQRRGGRGVKGMATKEEDFLEDLFITSSHAYMLFFTNKGKVYWLKVYEIPLAERHAKGKAIINLLELEPDEKATALIAVRDFEKTGGSYLMMATKHGIIKKSEVKAYSRPRKGGIIALTLDEGDRLIDVQQTSGNDDIMLTTEKGIAIRFSEKDARPIGRTSRGVKGLTLKKGDSVVGMSVVSESDSLLTACINGYGKRTLVERYRKQKRGGKGIKNIITSERNGNVVAVRKVEIEDEIMLITKNGIINRQKVKEIRAIGRNTMGVRLLKLDSDDALVSVARIAREDIVDNE